MIVSKTPKRGGRGGWGWERGEKNKEFSEFKSIEVKEMVSDDFYCLWIQIAKRSP